MKSKDFNQKIRVYGSEGEIEAAVAALNGLALTGGESQDRLLIQEMIDTSGIKAKVSYEGNSVWGANAIVAEFKRILKAGKLDRMTDHFYKFLTLACGSIAHYDKHGWVDTYENSAERLCKFFCMNEYNVNVFDFQPHWATDRRRIASELLKLAKAYLNGEREKTVVTPVARVSPVVPVPVCFQPLPQSAKSAPVKAEPQYVQLELML